MGASFVQQNFLGGRWSARSQGRMADPAYKTAMSESRNGFPLINGSWSKRSGTRFLATTRGGRAGRLTDFDFSITQPFQLEWTDGFVRFLAGLSYVTTIVADGTVTAVQVTNTNPAKLVLATAIPATWANGNSVVFRQTTIPPSSTFLLNRVFVLADKNTGDNSFTLKDPITGAYIDATTYGYVTPATPDTVEKIFELATPYTGTTWENLRWVQDDTTVLLLHSDFQPRVIAASSSPGPFAISLQDFMDGPYLDLNVTTTTLTPSGTTGSISLTASAQTGINGGSGFLSTDVGRLVRFQSGPPQWSAVITYAKNFKVTGSDGNVYLSVAGANLNHDPTTDDGTHWLVDATTVTWTWLKITARSSATVVTATVMGADLSSANATTAWRLGLYSDTTGWPTCGSYHEDRLWLSGVVGNRVDGSKSGDHFNFEPTGTDGTVADDNAVAVTAVSDEVDAFFWMLSTDDGLMLGAQDGEWRIKASALDDPISPSSIQMRRVSTYGCANVDPVNAGQTVFVQRAARKMLAHQQVTGEKYTGDDISVFADDLTAPGIAEIRWQQEPGLFIWQRMTDGSLVGCVFQKSLTQGQREITDAMNVHGFFPVDLGNGRIVESISAGPTYDGLSDAIYLVTNQPDEDAPDFNVRWVEVLMPVFDDSQADWSSYFVDGGANPSYAQRFAISNGDSFDGIRIYGLWNLNGQSVAPVLGGLDLGDRAVVSGSCEVPFGSDPEGAFTLAFFVSLSDGTDYLIFEASAGFVVQGSPIDPTVPANTLLAYVGADANVVGSSNFIVHLDPANNRVVEVKLPKGGDVSYQGGLRILSDTTGAESLQNDNQSIFGVATSLGAWSAVTTYAIGDVVTGSDTLRYRSKHGANLNHDPVGNGDVDWEPRAADSQLGATVSYLHANGFLYSPRGGAGNSVTMSKINATTLVEDSVYGLTNSSLAGSIPGRLQCAFNSVSGLRLSQGDGTYHNYIIFCGIRAASVINEITLVRADTMAWSTAAGNSAQLDENFASVCVAVNWNKFGLWHATGQPYPGHWPLLWSGATTYAAGDRAYGSNGNLYTSNFNSNTGNDPTTDAVNWTQTAQAIGLYQFAFDETANVITRRGIKKIGPKDIDSTWTTITDMVGPALDKSDNNILCLIETDNAVTNQHYLVKFNSGNGAVVWKVAIPESIASLANQQTMSVMDISCRIGFLRGGVSDHNAYVVDTTTGVLTTQAINTGFTIGSAYQYYDCVSGSVTFYGDFTPPGTGPAMSYLGDYLADNGDTLSGQQGRLYLGISCCGEQTVTEYHIPLSMGAAFTMRGQLLRPDAGNDAGARNGPAFGKKRRLHWWAGSFYRTRSVSVGTSFDKLRPLTFKSPGGTVPVAAPSLSSYTYSDTIDSEYDFEGRIAWESTRPYPCVILAVGGYLETQDK